MKKTEIKIDISSYPEELGGWLSVARVFDSRCASGAEVLYLDSGYYLKSDREGSLCREHAMTKLFFERGLAPEPVAYISQNGRDYLLTRELVGEDMTHYLDKPVLLTDRLAEAMRGLHEIEPFGVPVSVAISEYASIADTCEDREYDEAFLSSVFPISSVDEARELVREYRNKFSTDTLIHGDFCLPNVILDRGDFAGFIDLGYAGAGDRHIDVFWAVWTLAYNLGTNDYADRFLDAYGREGLSIEKLRAVAAFSAFG